MSAVLFDLDGTLVDTPVGIARILTSMYPTAGAGRIAHAIGRPLKAVLAELTGRLPNDPAVEAAAAEFRRRFTEEVVPRATELVFPGVPELLSGLRGSGAAVAVVTSKSPAGAAELLAATGLDKHCDAVVGFTSGLPGKPAPHQALEAACVLGVEPSTCLVVGDSTADILMARAAGMTSVGVGFGVHSVRALADAGANHLAPTPAAMAATVLAHTLKEHAAT